MAAGRDPLTLANLLAIARVHNAPSENRRSLWTLVMALRLPCDSQEG
jgi:hypothetical protein